MRDLFNITKHAVILKYLKVFIFNVIILKIWVCARVCTCVFVSMGHSKHVEVSGQSAGIVSLFLPRRCWIPNSSQSLGFETRALTPSAISPALFSEAKTIRWKNQAYFNIFLSHFSQNCLVWQPMFTEHHCVSASVPNALRCLPVSHNRPGGQKALLSLGPA